MPLPEFREARVESADLTDLQPAEYRADLVIQLSRGKSVYGIVLEVQLAADEDKRFVWPAYVSNLRARLRCPVSLLVVTADESVARANPELAVLSAMAQGRAELILEQLASRFGPVGADIQSWVMQLSVQQLSAIGNRLLSAPSLEDALR